MKMRWLLFLCVFFVNMAFALDTPGYQLQDKFKNIVTIKASFTQQLYNGKGKLLRTEKGTMAIKRPGKFRWDITSPSPLLILANNKQLLIYDKNLRQATLQSVSRAVGSTPASLLSSASRVLTNYFIVQYTKGWFILRPRYGGSNFNQVRMKFNGNKIAQMLLIDQLGRKTNIHFHNVSLNHGMSPALFRLNVPRGVDVIKQ